VLAFCRARLRTPAPVLIEGVGGVMVPLDATHTVLDLMTDLALPVILVAGSYLGTLSHTLTAHAVLRQQGLACVLAVSESADSRIDPVQTAAALERRTGAPTLLLRRAGNPEAAFAALARAVAALPYFAGGGFSTNS
jgi:dethiobiotin synthetase